MMVAGIGRSLPKSTSSFQNGSSYDYIKLLLEE
jgi:hypothetical protein